MVGGTARGDSGCGIRLPLVLALVAAAALQWGPPPRGSGAGSPAGGEALAAIPVVVDVAPGLCPNHLRIDSPLTLAVGIIGTADLDVTTVEPATVRLSREGGSGAIAPLDYAYKDVGSPLIGGRCECQEPDGDGLGDLVLYFDIKSLVTAFGLAGRVGDTVPLALAGSWLPGTQYTVWTALRSSTRTGQTARSAGKCSASLTRPADNKPASASTLLTSPMFPTT